jgi:hypothetical protein
MREGLGAFATGLEAIQGLDLVADYVFQRN